MDVTLQQYLLFWIIVVGLCLGSFYNVVILRTLSGESIVFPPSKCPKCGHKLYPWHNIPVLSYIFLRGKCYFCKEKISIQYPIIEIVTMLLFVFSFLKFGLSYKCLFSIILSSCLLIMTMTDLKEKLVDCNIAIFLGIIGLIYNHNLNSLYGLIVGFGIIEIIAALGHLLKKGRAMGEADSYVSSALGACFGLSNIFTVLLYSLVAAMCFIIPIFLYNQYKNNNKTVCWVFVLFIITTILFKYVSQSYIVYGGLLILGLALCYMILKNLRTETNSIYLPFVPALAAGALYFLFF